MSELSGVLEKGFKGMTQEDPVAAGQALRDYHADVKSLDADGKLTAEELEKELIDGDQELHSRIGETVSTLLESITYKSVANGEEMVMFQDGISMVVVDHNGKVISFVDRPLDDETLKGYGNHLHWGLKNMAHTVISHAQTGADIDRGEGYRIAAEASKDKRFDEIPFPGLIHLGSTVVEDEEGQPKFASTSGMLLRDEVIQDILDGPEDNPLVKLAHEAQETGADDKFKGNIFIGSLESAFSKAVLEVALGQKTVEQIVAEWSLDSLVAQREQGINPH